MTEYDDKRTLICIFIYSLICRRENSKAPRVKETARHRIVAFVALSNLGCYVNYWDSILVYIISEKFGSKTQTEWNLKRSDIKKYASY